ncbi:TrgA family protein [Aliishimia ponticola]|uniref:TrgA family protein n=1 Tax=Aliishimia ponticola TaxID=2499833 RepID=A0A4S4NK70_9RHOB|nr:TrgA family protein [Aliishimia ponticola]THH38671.1 TrgA family protein [Aliishimia ponticola]
MPDAARLVAAVSLAIVAFLLSGLIMPVYEEAVGETNFGYFVYVNVVVGIVVGWVSMGKRAGRGVSAAITNGITGVFLLMLWGLFLQACNEMVRLAMKNRYDGPFDAIAAVFEIGAEWGLLLLTAPIIGTAAVGAFVSGVLTEYAWRTWR